MVDFVTHKGFRWEVETFGHGDEILLAFHGFGNHGSDFRVFEPALGKKYTVLAFTLPYHSREWQEKTPGTLSPADLGEFIGSFLAQRGAEKFSLAGYSLGGKIALQLMEIFPERIRSVYLFAPDGIRPSFSNAFVTRSLLGKKIYHRIIRNPSGLFRLVRLLEKSRVLNPKLAGFVRDSLSSQKKREQVWNVWMCFRDIRPSVKRVQQLAREYGIRLHLFFGAYDRIIPPSIGKQFVQGLDQKNALHVVEAGHNLFKEKVNDAVRKAVQE